MTWLAIDAGNSHVVIGVFGPTEPGTAPRPLRVHRLSTHPIGTPDELRARIHAVLADGGGGTANSVTATGSPLAPSSAPIALASVVPAFTRAAREAFPDLKVISAEDKAWRFSFRIGTESPAQTGIDRLVNAEAVARSGGGPAIIVDSGTTTTICALSSDGVFLGGAILPGIEACRDSLPGRAAQLFAVELVPPQHAIGRGTESALRSGVVLGYASMIEGMISRFERELAAQGSPRPRIVLTGGVSRLLRETSDRLGAPDTQLDPDLTLKGIAYLYESLARQ
jgi:type III pantothenate kinase